MIIYFSGTGNTRLVAETLGRLCNDSNIIALRGNMLTKPEKHILDCSGDRFIVWAFPTYSWGVPPVVADYIRRVKAGADVSAVPHYMVATCGDDTGRTDRQWESLVRQRGWNPCGAFAVIMPNTYTLMKGFDVDPADVAERKLCKMPEAVRAIAETITTGKTDRHTGLHRGRFARIKSGIIYPWFKRFCMSPDPFHSTGGCTGCGLCARECPMENIKMTGTRAEGMRPEWGKNCALCLRCYHICPNKAVAYGRSTQNKGQYINR